MLTLKHKSSEEKAATFSTLIFVAISAICHCTARALSSWGPRLPQCLSIPWLSRSANTHSLVICCRPRISAIPTSLCSGDLWDPWAKVNSCLGIGSWLLFLEPQLLCTGPGPSCCSNPWDSTGVGWDFPQIYPCKVILETVSSTAHIPLYCAWIW